ncbi:MAG: hypothetical protein GEU91_04585 [Rhizobiales bacterium]|nr:hypothetical protein [Hyphomicrobiales bacterium]
MFSRKVDSVSMPRDTLRLHPAIKDVVFAHIPKTAGTSMRNMLVAALPGAIKIFDYGPETGKIEGDFVNMFTGNAQTPEEIFAMRGELARDQSLLVSGHFNVGKYLGAFHPASFITFLRHPLERIVSSYKYYVRSLSFKGSFSEFYETPGHINAQSRMLWGIDLRTVGFIGLTESMPDMIEALSRHLDVDLRNRKDNTGRRFGGPAIDESVRSRIMALNDDDMQLYRHVEANLDYYTNYRGRSNAGLALARGTVNLGGNGLFRGWAAAFQAGRLVEIEVKAGARVIHRCYADQFMPNLRKRHLVSHGVGGFSVRLPPQVLAGQTHVRFVIAGTEQDLDGSPVTL